MAPLKSDIATAQARIAELELALRWAEERYAFADASGDGHCDWLVEPDIFYGSPRFLELIGLPPDTVFGGRAGFIEKFPYHPDDREAVVSAMTAHFRSTARRLEMDMRLIVRGEEKWIHVSGVCTRQPDGKLTRWTSSMTDITERRRAEAERRQASRLEAVGRLASGVAHDFNNILAGVLGYGELAQRQSSGKAVHRSLDSIMRAGNRGKALVERLLAFSRGGTTEGAPGSVADAISEVVALVKSIAGSRIVLRTEFEKALPLVSADDTILHQIIMNLCTNAVHAMPDGGALTLRAKAEDVETSRTGIVGRIPAGQYVKLEVVDTGTGIDAKILEQIFDPFFTTKPSGLGTGLGLAVVQNIVADAGGMIEIDTGPRKGTTFAVHLPVATAAERTAGASPSLFEASRAAGQRLLVVDDEEELATLVGENARLLGFVPTVHSSSTDALKQFEATPEQFDLLIADQIMPTLSGLELIRRVRARRPHLPVILISGNPDNTIISEAQALGIRSVLRKPVLTDELHRNLVLALEPSTTAAVG